jgi:hypothetical protein
MPAVRYVALVALVLWIGGMTGVVFGNGLWERGMFRFACGAVIVVCLFVMKFVGPPPGGFIPRVAITMAMLVLAVIAATERSFAGALQPIAMALGFVLLFWYVRE